MNQENRWLPISREGHTFLCSKDVREKSEKKKREINQAFTHSQTTQHKRKRKNNFKKKAQFRKESESIETCKRRQNDIARELMRSLLDVWNSTQRGTTDDTLTPYMFLHDNHVPPQTLMKLTKQLQHQEKTAGAHFRSQQVARHHNIKESVKT